MSPRKPVVSLSVLSYSALGQYLRSYVRVVSSRSYTLANSPKSSTDESDALKCPVSGHHRLSADTSDIEVSRGSRSLRRISSMRGLKYEEPVEGSIASHPPQSSHHEESCEGLIESAIKKFHDLMFECLPWYCHQRLAEVFLQVLGESAAACKMLYRKWDEAHLCLHHVQVNRVYPSTAKKISEKVHKFITINFSVSYFR